MAVNTISLKVPATARSASQTPLRTGVAASLVAAAAAEAFTLAARGAGVIMKAADPGAGAAKSIPVGGVAVAVLMNAAAGLLVAAALVRWTKAPAKAFVALATTYTALSLLGPIFASHTHLATKVVLLVAHLIAAAVIVPPVANRLGATNP